MLEFSRYFGSRDNQSALEKGLALAPRFDDQGLIPVITTDYYTGVLLMQAYMNAEALCKTVRIKQAVYYSRSRKELWHKGASSGQYQIVKEIRVDCDQDSIWLRVEQQGGGACHVGYPSCFYRTVVLETPELDKPIALKMNQHPAM
ncbi:MAG: phosphoribosyl-AMP cyclohydrolase [Verrucomicrobiota bacterium]